MKDIPTYYVEVPIETFDANSLGYSHFVKIEDKIAGDMFINNARRVLVSHGDFEAMHMSIAKNKDFYYILIARDLLKKFKKRPGDTLSLKIESDRSEYGYPLPEEFTAIFEYDDEAKSFFDGLTPGNKRNLIRTILGVKSDNLRAEKSLIIMEHLKRQNGNVDYKQLRSDMKEGI